MSAVRIRTLAKELDIDPRNLLNLIRGKLPKLSADSVMSNLTEEDVVFVVRMLATQNPPFLLQGTRFEGLAQAAHQDMLLTQFLTKQRREAHAAHEAREAEHERQRTASGDNFGDRNISAAEEWQAFQKIIERARRLPAQTAATPSRPLVSFDDLQVTASAEPLPFAQTMARRRFATSHIGARAQQFTRPVLEDVILLDFDQATHARLLEHDEEMLRRVHDQIPLIFPCKIDWDYACRYSLDSYDYGRPPSPTTLSRAQFRETLRSEDTLEQELAAMHSYEELTDEQFERISRWLQGEEGGEVDYEWLRAIFEDEYALYSSALSLEQTRARRVMLDTCEAHLFGDREEIVRTMLHHENENTRYCFILYLGAERAIGSVLSFEL